MERFTISIRHGVRHVMLLVTLLAGTLAVAGVPPAYAATIAVDGVACTLPDALTAANTDTAVGGCAAGSGADVIELLAGATYELTAVDNTVAGSAVDGAGANGLPVVTSEIAIHGNGATIQRSVTAPNFRILSIASTGDLTLENVTVTGGLNPRSFGAGGAIFNGGSLTLRDTTITGNRVRGGEGGGIFNAPDGILSLHESTVSFNTVSRDGAGGGIYNDGGTIAIDRSLIEGNNAGQDGAAGGIANDSANLTITSSTFRNNTLGRNGVGGAIATYGFGGIGGVLTVVNTTFTENGTCCFGGGAIAQRGGAIWARDSLVTLDHVTIVGNRVNQNGAGVLSAGMEIQPGTTVIVRNSIIAGNLTVTGEPGVDPEFPSDVSGDVVSGGYNLIGDTGGSSGWVATDLIGPFGALVEPLAANGGPTDTMALSAGSPAIDLIPAGVNGCGTAITADQRGGARPLAQGCDAGAYEVGDSDADGVADTADACPGTVLPDDEPPQLKRNRYYANADGDFVDVNGDSSGISVVDTGGCSASQVVAAAGLGRGHERFGITRSALLAWIASLA